MEGAAHPTRGNVGGGVLNCSIYMEIGRWFLGINSFICVRPNSLPGKLGAVWSHPGTEPPLFSRTRGPTHAPGGGDLETNAPHNSLSGSRPCQVLSWAVSPTSTPVSCGQDSCGQGMGRAAVGRAWAGAGSSPLSPGVTGSGELHPLHPRGLFPAEGPAVGPPSC